MVFINRKPHMWKEKNIFIWSRSTKKHFKIWKQFLRNYRIPNWSASLSPGCFASDPDSCQWAWEESERRLMCLGPLLTMCENIVDFWTTGFTLVQLWLCVHFMCLPTGLSLYTFQLNKQSYLFTMKFLFFQLYGSRK